MKVFYSQLMLLAGALLVVGLSVGTARADLVYLGNSTTLGSGIGGQQTLLSFQGQGANTTPTASITRVGSSDVVTNPPTTQINGGSNNQTRLFSEAGITDASQFRLVLNINEPDDLISVTALQAFFYNPANALIHTAMLMNCGVNGTGAMLPCTFNETGSGIGGSGQVFGLNQAQTDLLNGFGLGGAVRVGMSAAHSGEGGGFETYYIARGPGSSTAPIPEPTTMLLLGTGLAGLGAMVRKRRQAKTE